MQASWRRPPSSPFARMYWVGVTAGSSFVPIGEPLAQTAAEDLGAMGLADQLVPVVEAAREQAPVAHDQGYAWSAVISTLRVRITATSAATLAACASATRRWRRETAAPGARRGSRPPVPRRCAAVRRDAGRPRSGNSSGAVRALGVGAPRRARPGRRGGGDSTSSAPKSRSKPGPRSALAARGAHRRELEPRIAYDPSSDCSRPPGARPAAYLPDG